MGVLRSSLQLGQAVKNVQRLRHIIAVLGKYGFSDVITRMHLGRYLPAGWTQTATATTGLTTAARLKLAFEELGPSFVKLGQLLSMRSDLLPEEYLEEFTKLQDDVHPLPFEVIQKVVESELGKPLSELYLRFDEKPLAAASIGQVHAAQLLSGEEVVVKVQRPEIAKLIDQDVALLAFLAGLLEKYIPESRIIGPKRIVDEFFRTLSFELDFAIEANNLLKIAANMASLPDIVVPRLYKTLSTHKVMTQERFEGIRVNDLKALERAGIDKKQVVELGARAFFKSLFIDGLFHGDLHGGNLFILPGNRLGIIDFGVVGRLSARSRDRLATMVLSLMTEDYENLCYQYAELGGASASIDFEGFQREVQNVLAPYMGLSLEEMNAGKILIEATKIATHYQIQVPGDWMLVFKAIVTVEGMGRTLYPEFDLLLMGQDLIKDLVKNQYSMQRMGRELLWVAKDLTSLIQVLPRQLRWMFRKFNSNDFAIEVKIPELDHIRKQLDLNAKRQSLTLLVIGCFVASSLTHEKLSLEPESRLTLVYAALGVFFLVLLFFRPKK